MIQMSRRDEKLKISLLQGELLVWFGCLGADAKSGLCWSRDSETPTHLQGSLISVFLLMSTVFSWLTVLQFSNALTRDTLDTFPHHAQHGRTERGNDQ